MSTTLEQLDEFHRFARERLSQGEPELSIEDCLRLWRARVEYEETVAAVRQGVEDFEAGRFRSLEEADAEIRKRLGFGPRKQ